MKKYIDKTKQFFTNKDVTFLYILASIVFLAGITLLIWFLLPGEKGGAGNIIEEEINTTAPKECQLKSLFNGVCVETQEEVNPDVVAIMIENHIDARPQSGLSQATIVYEALVEGQITRFLALYPKTGEEVLKVGPVRSARSYYLDWLSEYRNPMYMHVGGSPEALDLIKEYNVFDLNEFYRGWYYWRDKNRHAPHNVYTSSELWKKAWSSYAPQGFGASEDKKEEKVEDRFGWRFETREACMEECVNEITVSFSPPTYEAVWKYNTSTQKYERYQAGYPHTDLDGSLITADTVIIQKVEATVIDNEGRLSLKTIGEGEATVFRNGYAIPAQWTKSTREARTIFKDVDFHDIAFKPGKIWIEVVSPDSEVNYK